MLGPQTNDLLRSIDASLNSSHNTAHTFLIMGRYCAAAILEEEKEQLAAKYATENLQNHAENRGLRATTSSFFRHLLDFTKLYLRYYITDMKLALATRIADWAAVVSAWWLRHHGSGISALTPKKIEEKRKRSEEFVFMVDDFFKT